MTKFFAGLAVAAVLSAPTFAIAAGEGAKKLSRADFEACNQQAMMIAGVETGVSPAASPATERPGAERDRATTPGTTGAPAASPGTGATGTEQDRAGTGAGVSGTTGAGPGVSGTTGAGATGTGMTGTGATGPGAPAGAPGERVGQEADLDKIVDAYRDCLQART